MASVTMEQCIEEEKDEPLVLLPKGKRMFFVAILYLCFTFDLAIRYGVNAILPLLQSDLGISGTQASSTALAFKFTKDSVKNNVMGARRL